MAIWQCVWIIVSLVLYMTHGQSNDCIETTAPPSLFLPFGLSEGDAVAPVNDDDSLGPITLNRAFLFFGQSYDSVWINTNGGVSFKYAVSTYVPEPFPLSEQYTMIVPYWTDIDTTPNVGRIYHRQTNDRNLLERAHLNNLRAADDLSMLVVTWHNVTYFGGGPCTSVNTFQLVMISAWSVSYAVFNYGDMQWIVSASTNLALAGYNAGDGENYYELPSSGSDDLATLAENSNVDVPGHWVFRVDGLGVRACETAPNATTPVGEYPLLAACSPSLAGPYVEDDLYVTFYCNVTMITTDPRARAEVTFLFDDEPASTVPVVTVSTSAASVPLHEKYLHDNMGRRVGCKVQTYWNGNPGTLSGATYSETYYAGIRSTATLLAINEEDDSSESPGLYSTLPITCSRLNSPMESVGYRGCHVNLTLITSENTFVFTRNIADNLVQNCRYTLHSENWNRTTRRLANEFATLVVMMKRNALEYDTEDGSINYKVLQTTPGQPRIKYDRNNQAYDNPWYSVSLGQVKVYRTGRRRSAMCYSSGDPRMSTFDGMYYSPQQEGIFQLVKSLSIRIFEVQIRHWACVEGESGCSIACAVAVREGNVAYGLDMCNRQKIVYPLERSETKLEYEPITSDASGSQWVIKMPSEAFVNVHIRTWGRGGMNVYVYVPPRDRGRTEGLCGTYDGDRSNDFRKSDGSTFEFDSWTAETHREVDSFIESWRIPPDESLFQQKLDRDDSLDEDGEFCSCTLVDFNTPTCGPRIVHDTTLNQLYPAIPIPGLSVTAEMNSRRRKRAAETGGEGYTDNIADGYVFGDVEESSYNPHNLTWPTWNDVTEQQAVSHCDSFLRNSVSASCLESVSDADFDLVVTKCTEDIQITGDLNWARDKVADVNNLCLQNIYSGTYGNISSEDSAARLQLLLQIVADTCPEQCSGYGTCQDSTCVCDSTHTGADCSLTVGEPPIPLEILSPAACDIRNRPCEKVRILADKLDNSERLTCRVDAVQMDGTRFTNDVRGSLTSYNVVECPLTSLYAIDAGSGPMPFYRYNISLSNDGVLFSDTPTPPGYTSGAAVYDSTCIECTEGGQCSLLGDTCLIAGKCYSSGDTNPESACEGCSPSVNSAEWSPLCIPEDPDQTSEGVTLVLLSTNVAHVTTLSSVIINVTATLLTEYCQDMEEECCQAMDYRYTLATDDGIPFVDQHVSIASGYPKEGTTGESVLVKLLVFLIDERLSSVCGEPRSSSNRRKREISGHYFDRDVLRGIIAMDTDVYKMALGIDVQILEDTPDLGLDAGFIAGVAVGGFCLLVIVIILIFCTNVKKPSRRGDHSSGGKHRESRQREAVREHEHPFYVYQPNTYGFNTHDPHDNFYRPRSFRIY